MPLQLFNKAERERLNCFPEVVATEDLSRHYELSAGDRREVFKQRDEHSCLGFALQLCSLRHLGFVPQNLLSPPLEALHFVADQLKIAPSRLKRYQRQATQNMHLRQAMHYMGFRRTSPLDELALAGWLAERALEHDKPLLLFEMACDFLRQRSVLRPGVTVLERHISEARSSAHRLTFEHLRPTLTDEVRGFLDEVSQLMDGTSFTHLFWLQQSPTDPSPTQIKEAVRKISYLAQAGVPTWDISKVNPNRLKWLAKTGARITKQNLLNHGLERRTGILIAFLHESLFSYTDDVIHMFDQRVWELYGQAKGDFEEDRRKARSAINEKLGILQVLGDILLDDTIDPVQVRDEAFKLVRRDVLSAQLEQNKALLRPEKDAYVDYFRRHYQSVRNVAKPLLATLNFEPWGDDRGLNEALELVREVHADKRQRIPNGAPTAFIPEDWSAYVWIDGGIDRHYYELAAIWVLRERLRSGDVYVKHSRRYAPVESYLIPKPEWPEHRLVVRELTGTPLSAEVRLTEREAELRTLCQQVETMVTDISNSQLRIKDDQLVHRFDEADDLPPRVAQLSATLTASLPQVAITDVLLEVDKHTGFSQAFEHLTTSKRTSPDVLLNLYACLLAQACNLGLAYMAHAADLDYQQLRGCNDWFVREETLRAANTILVNQHHDLPFSQVWGGGILSSSDGQRFPMTKQGKTLTARYNSRYFGLAKGVTFYTWLTDQFSQYGSKAIPSTVRDATYVLDAVLDNETELNIVEHTTDTSGYTELIFAVFDLLGLKFTPRIRDLKEQTLYRTRTLDLSPYPTLAPCLAGIVQDEIVYQSWDEMLRFVGSLKLGWVTASLVIQKLQAYPRKSQLTHALQAYGRLPKTIHILGWYTQETTRKRATRQLNKGESIHDLRAHLAFANQGKIGTKTDEQLAHQVDCLNLLSNIVIYWNTLSMQRIVVQLKKQGYPVHDEDLKHIWPTRYRHINVYGTYQFDREGIEQLQTRRFLGE